MSIKLSNIYHTYSKGTPFERLALQDVSLEIAKGEIVAIIGHTGSGKSTLVQHLNGLLKPDKGTATIDAIDITAKGQQAKAASLTYEECKAIIEAQGEKAQNAKDTHRKGTRKTQA